MDLTIDEPVGFDSNTRTVLGPPALSVPRFRERPRQQMMEWEAFIPDPPPKPEEAGFPRGLRRVGCLYIYESPSGDYVVDDKPFHARRSAGEA